jgi:TonB-linked SusC/RagA family outer membrane protein
MQFSFAQQKTVTGTVTSDGANLPGATVSIAGTQQGTQTDENGKFSIKAAQGDVLEISFLGKDTKKVTVGAGNVVNVVLSTTTNAIEAVQIVVALGVKRSQKATTVAAQSIQGSAMTEARESNLVNALSGKIAGVQVTNSSGAVGSSSRIVLRGVSTITGNSQPLFIVDGVPFDNSSSGNSDSGGGNDIPNGAASINPDDIESVTVLKGPTAAALYGVRASKGVIIITTKTGKKKDKFEVSFNSNLTFSDPLMLPSYQNSYGQGATDDFFEFVDGAGNGTGDGVDESWGPALDRGLKFVQWDNFKYGGAASPWVSRPDNVKDFFKTGISRANSLVVTGGSSTVGYRFSVGNSDETGMVPFTDYKKFNAGLNLNADLGKKLSAVVGITYFNDKSNNLPTAGYNNNNVMQQFTGFSARNVDFSALEDWRNLPAAPAGPGAGITPANWNNNYQNNPYWVLETNRNTFDKDRITGNFGLNYKFTEKLSLNGKLMLDQYSQRITNRNEKGTNSAADGSYSENNRRYTEINAETILSYKTNITSDLSLTLNGGMNSMKRAINLQQGTLDALELPGLFTLSNVKSGGTPRLDSDYVEQRINSVLGFGQFAYKTWAFLDFTARNDWASVFPTKNNSFFYPSVTGALVLSDIFGFQNSKVNYLKLRAGWAEVGSTGTLDAYSTNKVFNLTGSGLGTTSSLPNVRWNPNIAPETTIGTDFGLDLNAFNNRVRLAATYYDQRSSGLIIEGGISSSTGYRRELANLASMRNKGYEVQLGVTAVKAKDFSFDIDLNFAKNENVVESLGGADTAVIGGQWDMQLEARPGLPYGAIVGYPYSRTDDGQIIYENGLPKVNNDTKEVIGNITPDWTGGASFTLKYKGFDLNTLIDAKIGGDIFSMSYMWGRYGGTLEETLIGRETGLVGDGVMSDGAGGYVPNNVVVEAKAFNQHAYTYSNFTETGVFDASYVKLRQVVFGYSLPKKWLKDTFIQDFKLSVVGRNLAILHKNAPHIDPETGFSSANSEQGQEFGQLPSARSYGFNINIKF